MALAEVETEADIGYGTVVDVSTDDGATWQGGGQIAGDITPPSDQIDTPDATHMQSPGANKEFIVGLNDPGTCSYPVHFIASSTTDTMYRTVRAAREKVKVRITFLNGAKWTFTGLLTNYAPSIPIDNKMTATVTWKVSGSTVVS